MSSTSPLGPSPGSETSSLTLTGLKETSEIANENIGEENISETEQVPVEIINKHHITAEIVEDESIVNTSQYVIYDGVSRVSTSATGGVSIGESVYDGITTAAIHKTISRDAISSDVSKDSDFPNLRSSLTVEPELWEKFLPISQATSGFIRRSSSSYKAAEDAKLMAVIAEKGKILSLSREERRQHYQCKSNYVKLEDIQCWPEYFAEHIKRIDPPIDSNEVFDVNAELNKKMALFKGDITTLEIDAIVNAANESLLGGGGVDGAIHKAAGPSLLAECEALKGCHTGDAKITGGYYLPANYVIHTVGPRGEKPKKLKSCYETCLNILKSEKLKSVAFPCISTGIYGYPNKNACKIALKTIREWLEGDSYAKEIERIILCLFLPKDVQIYHQYMTVYFPVHEASSAKESGTSSSIAADARLKTKKQME